ncbi:hypothetical protein EXU57_24910 [Segetibacter sp. 3557_3]|uniref:hypothetical protein n=1 Tax=Segetibacter sp. 3557_3 TaxID=2547429 RepID=UPI0010588EB9|nr:hypothetical protein [Segetibacter sp. 3557_3]TDH17783.1 hypothetical protein EXU57_24910 [Segetibacter sp. 3557_3]
MFSTNDIENLYDTILSIPGMNDTVKIDIRLSRKNVLLLNKVIERGLRPNPDDKSTGLFNVVPPDALEQLSIVASDFLERAGLKELNEKLKSFGNLEGKNN